MKAILLFLVVVLTPLFSNGQDSLAFENAKKRIQTFNDSITKLLNQYEKDTVDFIAIRSTIDHGHNCRFIVRNDTCTSTFILHLGENDLITYIHVGDIASRPRSNNEIDCPKKLDDMYTALTHYEDYFTKPQPDYSRYDPAKIIFYGSVDGKYLYEVVDRDYFSTHHSGMFYATFRSYF